MSLTPEVMLAPATRGHGELRSDADARVESKRERGGVAVIRYRLNGYLVLQGNVLVLSRTVPKTAGRNKTRYLLG